MERFSPPPFWLKHATSRNTLYNCSRMTMLRSGPRPLDLDMTEVGETAPLTNTDQIAQARLTHVKACHNLFQRFGSEWSLQPEDEELLH